MPDHIEQLRENIRLLEPTGETGFEGLLAAVLTSVTGRTFALASSGAQRGRDGQSALDRSAVMFEAKRYDDAVPKEQLYSKLFELAANRSGATELFIVGATGPVSAQHTTTLAEGARQFAVALLVLAWPETGLPELAALLAMKPEVSADFIAKHTSAGQAEILRQLAAVRAHADFPARSAELMAAVRQPSVAPAFALKDNAAWLSRAFSDKGRARSVFGQALSPGDASTSSTVDRTDLRAKIGDAVFANLDGTVTAILGADGNGKSWIFAQAWEAHADKPLTVVIVPDDIGVPPSLESCQELLVSKLLTQTGETPKLEAKDLWLRHFERWRKGSQPERPRLVVFLDGVNQRESVDWLRLIDAMSALVAELGGKLVFSCRRFFYRDRLENKLVSQVVAIDVPEWTDGELDELLRDRGTSIAALDPAIVRSLRNPRIFGVAAALFKTEEIKEFGELSVNRLLFEHIRGGSAAAGTAASANQFAAEIRAHAERIVERLRQQQDDGLNEFEMQATAGPGSSSGTVEQFRVTAAGRFFEVVDEDPNKYVLKEEGLPIALGLALVTSAREALRRKRSVDDALSNILDPIAALDRTSDILLGAVLSAALEGAPNEIVAPLVRSFVMLQNLDSARYPEFRSLFGRAPIAFLAALEDCILAPDVVSNLSWLMTALNDLRGSEPLELALATAIHRWLSIYSLDAMRMVLVPNTPDQAEEREARRTEREQHLAAAVADLSLPEAELLAGMVREDRGDYCELSLVAFRALAGRRVAPFAESLRNWCFAASLNGGYRDHHNEFDALLHFNVVDWEETKDALRRAAELLRADGVSRTGQWALVFILRGTGDSGDAVAAERIAEDLTKDRPHFESWRLVEQYCASDPCDPSSTAPDNIGDTAGKYSAINPAELRRSMGLSQDDHFFTMAQPGMARFRPQTAIDVVRGWANEALGRSQEEFRLAAFVLENETVALEDPIAEPYVRKASEIAQATLDAGSDPNNQGWVAAQFALCIAFPHMTADAQFEALLSHPPNLTTLLNLCYLFQPISPSKLEASLERAVAEGDGLKQSRVLCFAEYSNTPLTARAKDVVFGLLGTPDDSVRLAALSLARATADPVLLRGVVESGWSATTTDIVSRKVEILHGSEALVLAAEAGVITVEACLDRIAFSAFESFVVRLGPEGARAVADRLTAAIRKAAVFPVTGNLPDIEQVLEGRYWPVIFEVSEKAPDSVPLQERFRRIGEPPDAWHERQQRNRDAADRFERELTTGGAQLIMQSITGRLVGEIDKVAPDAVDSWAALLGMLDDAALNNLHNVALVVAQAISWRDPAAALALFRRLEKSSPHVRVTFGDSRLSLDAVAAWGAAGSAEGREFCFGRLDRIGNDADLSTEILAAIKADRLDVLRDYVLDRRGRREPAHRARAAMVAGLSPDEPWALEAIEALSAEQGFLQHVYSAARYAMERHQWSRHWAAQMREATDGADLWRYAALLGKIVDGRLSFSELQREPASELIERFGATLHSPIRSRIRKWASKRQSKLFGMDQPDAAFLPSG